MKSNLQRAIMCLVLLFGIIAYTPVTAKAATLTTGRCGTEASYSFDEATGTLTISGKGSMTDYGPNNNKSPFTGSSEIKAVVIADGITTVGEWAFYDCFGLESVSLGKDVKKVSDSAFRGCIEVGSLTMQEGLTTIGYSAFAHCMALDQITLPQSVTYIGERAFDNTGYYRKKSNWENDVLYLDGFLLTGFYNGAYFDKKNKGSKPYWGDGYTQLAPYTVLVSGHLDVKPGTKMIVDKAFAYTNLKGITLPQSVVTIGNSAFAETKIKSIELPKGITKIENYTFNYCTVLASITIPDSVTEIGNKAFYGCTGLASVTIGNKVSFIDDSAFKGSGLKKVTIPKNVKRIGNEAFANCVSLKSLTIKKGVSSFGDKAFYGCTKLKKVTIPKSVKRIGSKAFGYKYGNGKAGKVSGFKIIGYKKSAAQKYAKKSKIKFKLVK